MPLFFIYPPTHGNWAIHSNGWEREKEILENKKGNLQESVRWKEPSLLEHILWEHKNRSSARLDRLDDGIRHKMRRIHVTMVETQSMPARTQLQLCCQHISHKHLVPFAVDDKGVEDLLEVGVAAVALHLLEEADAVVERQAEAHLVATEKDDKDDDDQSEQDDGGADERNKELLTAKWIAVAVFAAVVRAAERGHEKFTAARLFAGFAAGANPQKRTGFFDRWRGGPALKLAVICNLVRRRFQPLVEAAQIGAVTGPEVGGQSQAHQIGIPGGQHPHGEVGKAVTLQVEHLQALQSGEGDVADGGDEVVVEVELSQVGHAWRKGGWWF